MKRVKKVDFSDKIIFLFMKNIDFETTFWYYRTWSL